MQTSLAKGEFGFTQQRRDSVDAAYAKLDKENCGFVPLEVLTQAYNAKKHPHVAEGDLAPSVAHRAMVNALTPSAQQYEGKVAYDDFVLFHERMSAEVDAMRLRNAHKYFVTLVDALWGTSVVRLQPTGVTPLTLDVPTGLYATRKMDLLWTNASGEVVGFKNVVKPIFARKSLPEALMGHFAFPEESKEIGKIAFLPPQSAIQPPYDIVWPSEEDANKCIGIKGAVASNVDLRMLPPALRGIIISSKEAAERSDIGYLDVPTQAATPHPMYTTTSSAVGTGVDSYTQKVQAEKASALSGTNPVGVYAGRVGKFTSTFAGGMPTASGLNFSTK